MSKESKKAYSAVEVARLLSKSMRDEFQQFKSIKKAYSPKEAHLRLTDAVRKEIELYQEKLVKMRQAEQGELLEKALDFHSYGMVDDQHKRFEGDHSYVIHQDTKTPHKDRKFALSHENHGHLSFHPTMASAKKAAAVHLSKNPVNKQEEVLDKAAAIGDPSWDKGYNVYHEAAHGSYRSSGALKSGSKGVEVQYTPKKGGKVQHLGFHPTKEAATQARLEHHDRISAGFKKDDLLLDKGLQGLASDPHTDTQLNHEMMAHKPSKNVFDVIKKKTAIPMAMAERKLEIDQPSEVHTDPKVAGAVLPSDKPSGTPVDDSGSGGVVKKGKPLKKSETVFEILKKSHSFLGGRDQASKDMTGQAMMAAPKAMEGATGAPKPKMPSQDQHANRADGLQGFMPPGKFGPVTGVVKDAKHNQAMDLKNTQMPTRQQSKNVFSILKNKPPKVNTLLNTVDTKKSY